MKLKRIRQVSSFWYLNEWILSEKITGLFCMHTMRLMPESREQYLIAYLITFFTCVLPDTQTPYSIEQSPIWSWTREIDQTYCCDFYCSTRYLNLPLYWVTPSNLATDTRNLWRYTYYQIPKSPVPVVMNSLQLCHKYQRFIKHTTIIFTVLPSTPSVVMNNL